ncbi:MAG: hypothetical protein E6H01_13145 [Bacillati bacterium ANGP1]|uniref:Uncharacterized protein n=1 Tax=Candidatus Segetimicrobium genomatis TaxID=2569760 RepID=A0A537KP84_9BACT|nr:MAG: hypothetical protein E6H01_13145 [Terrabacteria group bacterium ANGP1]
MDELFVDPNQMVQDAIVSALKPHARLAATGWGFYPDPRFDDLDAQQRMLVVLLGRKASHLAQKVATDRISRQELCTLAAVGDGTFRPYAPRMERAGLIRREGDEIWIPDESVVRAANVVLGRLSVVETRPGDGGKRNQKSPADEEAAREAPTESDNHDHVRDETVSPAQSVAARKRRRQPNGFRRARSAKDFMVLYSGKVDLSVFPHPDDLEDPVRLALLPLLIARDGYHLEGLPLREIVTFLREKYGREAQESEIEAALNSVRGRHVDYRFDTHLSQKIYCLLDQGRAFVSDLGRSSPSPRSAGDLSADGAE